MVFSEPNYDKMAEECDLVFTAVPHGTATEIVKALYDREVKVIDLSADYRLHNPEDYDKWYGWQHPHADYLPKSVFWHSGAAPRGDQGRPPCLVPRMHGSHLHSRARPADPA